MRFSSFLSLAAGAFVLTNLDDLALLVTLFMSSRFSKKQIVAGQLFGMTALCLISLVASWAIGKSFPSAEMHWLGIVPIALGMKLLWKEFKTGKIETTQSDTRGILGVFLLTLANGADNLAVYTSMFFGRPAIETSVTIIAFLFFTVLWCAIAHWISRSTRSYRWSPRIEALGGFVLPLLLIALGLKIITGGR